MHGHTRKRRGARESGRPCPPYTGGSGEWPPIPAMHGHACLGKVPFPCPHARFWFSWFYPSRMDASHRKRRQKMAHTARAGKTEDRSKHARKTQQKEHAAGRVRFYWSNTDSRGPTAIRSRLAPILANRIANRSTSCCVDRPDSLARARTTKIGEDGCVRL